jgi:hypothetical protein
MESLLLIRNYQRRSGIPTKQNFKTLLTGIVHLFYMAAFANWKNSTGTLALMPALNLLVQPGRTEPWLRAQLITALAVLPLRERGVQHAIEFILSVHPSSAGFSDAIKAGRGSGISHDALNAASRLLSSPPAGMSPDQWFSGIAPQLFSLLQGEGEPEMDRAAAFIIGFGILGRRQYGAPGRRSSTDFPCYSDITCRYARLETFCRANVAFDRSYSRLLRVSHPVVQMEM